MLLHRAGCHAGASGCHVGTRTESFHLAHVLARHCWQNTSAECWITGHKQGPSYLEVCVRVRVAAGDVVGAGRLKHERECGTVEARACGIWP
jgi:hypothetical protein